MSDGIFGEQVMEASFEPLATPRQSDRPAKKVGNLLCLCERKRQMQTAMDNTSLSMTIDLQPNKTSLQLPLGLSSPPVLPKRPPEECAYCNNETLVSPQSAMYNFINYILRFKLWKEDSYIGDDQPAMMRTLTDDEYRNRQKNKKPNLQARANQLKYTSVEELKTRLGKDQTCQQCSMNCKNQEMQQCQICRVLLCQCCSTSQRLSHNEGASKVHRHRFAPVYIDKRSITESQIAALTSILQKPSFKMESFPTRVYPGKTSSSALK